ncbi:hypothetical protein [Bacillus seohaeanensis]|uniref:Spo0E like sporulation regulatory protein n=1 Tax=Bacillus seohaeanensis TaxID=284580 RepID=A0ABW5RVY2_9BACI
MLLYHAIQNRKRMRSMDSNKEFENIIKESRQEVREIVMHLLTNDIDIATILYVLK